MIVFMKQSVALVQIVAVLCSLLIFTGCETTPEDSDQPPAPENLIQGIDPLVHEIAVKAVSLLSSSSQRNLAVYYFTVDGRESNISDYLITGLTTEIANLASEEITIVSRQGLDQVMSEQSLMVSDLVSEETQVDIGELLGADVILVGYISPLENYDKMNIQVIEVETGAVLGGFFIDYVLESGFQRDNSSQTITVGAEALQIAGVSTVRTIYEDFDGAVVSLSPSHYEEYWGERIIFADAATGISGDGYGYLQFEAEFDSSDILADWNDSDLNFYLIYRTEWKTRNQDGVNFSIYPEGFSEVSAFIQQPSASGEPITRMAAMTLNPDEWTNLQIPFTSFMDISDEGEIDLNKPVSVGFAVPYMDNVHSGNFGEELKLQGRLRVDNLGLFKLNEKDPEGLIEAYEDDVTRAPGLLRIGGSGLYVDYSESDAGESRLNKGVENQTLRIDRIENGPGGAYLRLSGRMEINEAIQDFLDDEQDLYVIYSSYTDAAWDGFETLTLLIRSEGFESCYMEMASSRTGEHYASDFNLNSSWTRIAKPLEAFTGDNRSLADEPPGSGGIHMNMIFPVSRSLIRRALESGVLEFSIDLDQIVLQ